MANRNFFFVNAIVDIVDYKINYEKLCYLMRQITIEMN